MNNIKTALVLDGPQSAGLLLCSRTARRCETRSSPGLKLDGILVQQLPSQDRIGRVFHERLATTHLVVCCLTSGDCSSSAMFKRALNDCQSLPHVVIGNMRTDRFHEMHNKYNLDIGSRFLTYKKSYQNRQ